jgi:hypothetical protein
MDWMAGHQWKAFGSGLINNTWKVINGGNRVYFTKSQSCCFKEPQDIANNISLVGDYLKRNHPDYKVRCSRCDIKGRLNDLHKLAEGYFRMFPFVAGSHSKDVVETAEQA